MADDRTNGPEEVAPGGRSGAVSRTFLIADVRGYTRYTHERGDDAAASLAARFAELAQQGIAQHGGELLELRGDEALGVFTSARDALRASVDLQRLFRERTDGEPALPLGVGIGLDAGEAVPVAGGYRGGALNLAARLCSLAAPGQILASETVVSLARRVEGIRFEKHGAARLKGLEDPVTVIEVISELALPPVPTTRGAALRRFRRKHVTRRRAGAGIAVALVAGAAAVLAIAALGDTVGIEPAQTRVALVRPAQLGADHPIGSQLTDGLLRAERAFGLETETITIDETDDSPEATERLTTAVREGDFDLVIVAGGSAGNALASEAKKLTDTHFVYLDAPLENSPLEGRQNATAFFVDERDAVHLAGFLGALMSRTGAVGVIGGYRGAVEGIVNEFVSGARAARRRVAVSVDYSDSFEDQPVCEELANKQIDAGSDVIFAIAGRCGLGALSAAGIRGAWGIGIDSDQSYLGPHILASVVKRFDRVVEFAIRSFLDGTLPGGETVPLGIEQDAAAIVGIDPSVPQDVRIKLAAETARIRKQSTADGSE